MANPAREASGPQHNTVMRGELLLSAGPDINYTT